MILSSQTRKKVILNETIKFLWITRINSKNIFPLQRKDTKVPCHTPTKNKQTNHKTFTISYLLYNKKHFQVIFSFCFLDGSGQSFTLWLAWNYTDQADLKFIAILLFLHPKYSDRYIALYTLKWHFLNLWRSINKLDILQKHMKHNN